ncbi:MAG: T9SS type A sorting domain-containing protein [Melioribacteraceae bacterium]|nr:T9SS type A sorting domain-containing protein [Melioribacteraceae bacterium]WKZ70711.1 MAG: T9SS type A sorting domain-containing protein [Melioribacteraceae bacterium]
MKNFNRIILLFLLIFITVCNAQEHFKKLDSVPKEFEEKYMVEEHDWRPLWVGNMWQYSSGGKIKTRFVEKDTVVNDQIYFKKVDYLYDNGHVFMWERNKIDFSSTLMLDVADVNHNSVYNEELLLDSVDMSDDVYYINSYRFVYPGWEYKFFEIPYETRVSRPLWYEVFGDTVLTREVSYDGFFQSEVLADGIGCILIKEEGHWMYLKGAIIYGEQYGTIVSVDEEAIDNQLALSQNYPNPFNPTTTIKFTVANVGTSRDLSLRVYDILGREIQTLLNKPMQPGSYEVQFDGSNLTSGVYFYVLETSGKRLTKKMLLVK